MQKLLNNPRDFVPEFLDGILAAHPDRLRAVEDRVLVRSSAPDQGKVGIVTGGGSGHLPLFLGYVGDGLADAVAVGNVFASPSAGQFFRAAQAVDGGAGVLFLFGNYGGDVMNVDMARELAADAGIRTETVLGADDVASAPRAERDRRRGVAGILFQYKAAGAAARDGATLDEVAEIARHVGAHTATMSVGLGPCVLPEVGRPTFELDDGAMEIGVGIHGEPGVRRGDLEPADAIATTIVETIVADLGLTAGDEVAVLVNGLGSTPAEELYVVYRTVDRILDGLGVARHRVWVGEYATSLEMAGASVSLLHLDERIRPLLDAPARSPFLVLP